MFVYSGKCRFCKCGLKTNLKTCIKEEPLRTGDIVVIFTVDENGMLSYFVDGLTVVVSEQYQPYSTGEHKCLKEYPDGVADDAFVMGIKDVVIDGERWEDYGFSYKEECWEKYFLEKARGEDANYRDTIQERRE